MTGFGGVTFMRGCVVLLALTVLACASPGRPSAASHGPINCPKLASLGVKTCPPADPTLFKPKLINDTNGQVTSSQFKAYAKGYLRNEAYQAFALNTNQPAMLRAGVLADTRASDRIFGTGLQFLSQAASEGGYLQSYGPVLTSLRLVVLPSNLRDGISSVGFQPSRLGWVATFGGPSTYSIVAGSRFTVLESVSSRVSPIQDLSWGTYQPKSALGEMWQFYGDTKCSADPFWESFCAQ